MESQIFAEIKTILSSYVNVSEQQLQMDADLVGVYGMDSTEMTALTKEIEEHFRIPIRHSGSATIWVTGNDIVEFVQREAARTVSPRLA